MTKRTRWWWLWGTVLVLVLAACGGGGASSGSGGHGVGDSATVGDVIITLDSATVINYKVDATFTIQNNGASDLALDPETSFTITGDNTGTEVILTLNPAGCDNSVTGTVPAGGTLTGELCWRCNPSDTWPLAATITYAGGGTDAGPAFWTVNAEQ